jgi:hypothetical protein
MATARFKGRTTAGTGDPEDLTPTQATALLDTMVGDAGGGGTKGLVTAPAAGDAAAGKFLHANGTWTVPAGGGDVVGPGSSTDNAAVRFDGTTGKILQNSAVIIADTTGDITGGKYNKLTITPPTTSATLTIADGKTFTTTFTGTFGGTDGTTHNFPLTSSTVARTDAAQTFTGLQTFNTGVRVASAQQIDFNADTILTRKGAANFQFGAADSGTPVAQTVSFQGASGSNVPGVNTIFNGSRGTGSGSGGDLQFQIAPVGAVGATVQNTLVPGLRIYDAGTTIVRVDAATSGQIGFTSRSRISSASNGTIKFTSNTGGPMTLATFGETTGGATDFTLTANSTSGTDQSAGNFIVQAPLATGTGRSGSVIVKTGAYTTGTTHTTGDRDFIYAGKTAFLTSSAWDDCFGMEVFGTEIASNGGSWAQVRSFKSLIDVIPGALDGIPPPESNYSTSISTTLSAGADNTSGGTTPVPSARRVGSQIFVEVISDATAAGGPHFCKWRVQINGGFGILVTPFN